MLIYMILCGAMFILASYFVIQKVENKQKHKVIQKVENKQKQTDLVENFLKSITYVDSFEDDVKLRITFVADNPKEIILACHKELSQYGETLMGKHLNYISGGGSTKKCVNSRDIYDCIDFIYNRKKTTFNAMYHQIIEIAKKYKSLSETEKLKRKELAIENIKKAKARNFRKANNTEHTQYFGYRKPQKFTLSN